MDPQTVAETLRLAKEALGKPDAELAKNVTISTGLTAYDLQAPAKNLYPTITPIRNSIPRVGRANPGDAARWRSIFGITGSGFDNMGWVPEGQRSASMNYSATPVTAPYTTLGEEDYITFEAESASTGFEDINATATMRLLQKTMRKEEMSLLGGNASLALGTPVTPVLTASGSGATLPAATYSVIVVALAFEGWKNSSLANGVATTKTITGNDGATFTLNGGSSNKSTNATQAVTLGQTLFATTTYVAGAVAYAWFVGLAGSETLQAITGINSATFTAPLTAGRQAAAAVTADSSRNASLAYDGLLNIALNPANGSYVQTLGTGTAGTGTPLTASGRGSVNEIDVALQAMWDNNRISPTVMYVNSQEQRNITSKCLSNASGPLVRYSMDTGNNSGGPYGITANGVVRWYYNPFSVDGGTDIPVKVHPDVPPGTILLHTEKLPEWYQSNEVPNVVEVLTRRDYYRIDWPLRTRRREFGVYTEQVLACYTPFALGVINNVTNG